MKKIKIGLKLLAIMLATFMSATYVKADTTLLNVPNKTFEDFYEIEITVENENIKLYDYFMNIFNNQSEYQYYTIDFYNYNDIYFYNVHFSMYNNFSYILNVYIDNLHVESTSSRVMYGWSVSDGVYGPYENNTGASDFNFTIQTGLYGYIDSNVDIIMTGNNYEITGLYNETIKINTGDKIPTLKELSNEDIRENYINGQGNYTTINLDDYEYVLLSLKNYNQIEAFQTNLQVKGQIGITPIYNFGQTSKDSITGAQVQDRCNLAYENYTSYPFYIIQTDLQNNVIYAVKECSEGSSFKFDNSIFDVTYITQANKDNPTITINGNTYDVIPYDELPSTATKNEEDNYIPGESGSASDTGGLDSAITGAQRKLSEIWNSITYFTSFIGQIFSSLPSEVHTILISAFTIMIMLGIIKIFLGK